MTALLCPAWPVAAVLHDHLVRRLSSGEWLGPPGSALHTAIQAPKTPASKPLNPPTSQPSNLSTSQPLSQINLDTPPSPCTIPPLPSPPLPRSEQPRVRGVRQVGLSPLRPSLSPFSLSLLPLSSPYPSLLPLSLDPTRPLQSSLLLTSPTPTGSGKGSGVHKDDGDGRRKDPSHVGFLMDQVKLAGPPGCPSLRFT